MFGNDINNYILTAVIREKGTSIIHLGKFKSFNNGPILVIKRTKEQSSEQFQLIQNEILVMRQLNHPNILQLEASFVCGMEIYMVHKCMKYGSCKDMMARFLVVGFPEIIVSLIARDILLAIDYLHKKGFIHRSICASHILLDDIAVLTGFKECVSLIENGKRIKRLFHITQSPDELIYAAPEVLEQNLMGYTEKSDIYSLGITMCELGNNITPFGEMEKTLMLTEKLKGNQPTLLDCTTYAVNTRIEDLTNVSQIQQIYATRKLSDPYHNFVEICLSKDPQTRPSAEKLLGHPFIKQSRNTSLRRELGEELKIDTLSEIFNMSESEGQLQSCIEEIQNISINNTNNFEWNF